MEKRYYLAMVFEDPKQDRLEPYGSNFSRAADDFGACRQQGGPEGILHISLLDSTGRVRKSSAVQPASWHKAQAEALRAPVVELPVEPTPEEAAATLATTLLEKQAAIAEQLESIRESGLVPHLLPVTAPAGDGAGATNADAPKTDEAGKTTEGSDQAGADTQEGGKGAEGLDTTSGSADAPTGPQDAPATSAAPNTGTQVKAAPVAGRGGKAPGPANPSQLPLGAGG